MKGAYVLLLRIRRDFSARVGSLGRVHFARGIYAYVGSGRSSLLPRLARHYAKKKKRHWHIDYLTTSSSVVMVTTIYSHANSKEIECRLSARISALPYSEAVPSFGSSDCKHRCRSHLYLLKSSQKLVTTSICEAFKKESLVPLKYAV